MELVIVIPAIVVAGIVLLILHYHGRVKKSYESLTFQGYSSVAPDDRELARCAELLQSIAKAASRLAPQQAGRQDLANHFHYAVKKQNRRGDTVYLCDLSMDATYFPLTQKRQQAKNTGTAATILFTLNAQPCRFDIVVRRRMYAFIENLLASVMQPWEQIAIHDTDPVFQEKFQAIAVDGDAQARIAAGVQNNLLKYFSDVEGRKPDFFLFYVLLSPRGWAIVCNRISREDVMHQLVEAGEALADSLVKG